MNEEALKEIYLVLKRHKADFSTCNCCGLNLEIDGKFVEIDFKNQIFGDSTNDKDLSDYLEKLREKAS